MSWNKQCVTGRQHCFKHRNVRKQLKIQITGNKEKETLARTRIFLRGVFEDPVTSGRRCSIRTILQTEFVSHTSTPNTADRPVSIVFDHTTTTPITNNHSRHMNSICHVLERQYCCHSYRNASASMRLAFRPRVSSRARSSAPHGRRIFASRFRHIRQANETNMHKIHIYEVFNFRKQTNRNQTQEHGTRTPRISICRSS